MNRDDILVRATEIVETDGPDALSIRGLARDLGVSAPALYDHVDSKDHLLRMIATNGYDQLGDRWAAIDGPPVEWLLKTGRAYVRFAVERPGLFALMHRFAPGAILGDPAIEHPAATRLFAGGIDRISEAITRGELRDDDPIDLATALWAAAHGVATVAVMLPPSTDTDAIADRVVGGLLAGLRPTD